MSRLLPAVVAGLLLAPRLDADDEKLAKRSVQLTAQLVKALETLAKTYDEKNDPEAAHFLASSALGFGSKDPKIALIKGAREVDLFVGKLRGGEELADANPIDTALRGIETEAKKLYDTILPALKKGELSAAAKDLLHDLVPKYEIARGAEDYIRATQRFNKLRRAMGLRALLWDFEKSRQLILACWYMGETEDYRTEDASDKASPLYSEGVEAGKKHCSGMLFRSLKDVPDDMRPYAFVRQDLLNPEARLLWLAHWAWGKKIQPMTLYAIPRIGFRGEIPTPSQRLSRASVIEAWPDWKDTEDTVPIQGVKAPLVRYPYEGEVDAPAAFSNGRGAMEYGWQKSEHEFLAKAGVPIMLRIFAAGMLSEVKVELRSASGQTLPTRVYQNGDPRADLGESWMTVLAVPESKLDPGASYAVRIACKASGTAVERSWSFKVRPR